MKLITQRSQIKAVQVKWLEQMDELRARDPRGDELQAKTEINERLKLLDCELATPEQVVDIIGYDEWCSLVKLVCDECLQEVQTAVEFGYRVERRPARICQPCIHKADAIVTPPTGELSKFEQLMETPPSTAYVCRECGQANPPDPHLVRDCVAHLRTRLSTAHALLERLVWIMNTTPAFIPPTLKREITEELNHARTS